jgi:VanZ family protein
MANPIPDVPGQEMATMRAQTVSWPRIAGWITLGWTCYVLALVWGSLSPIDLDTGMDNGDKLLHFLGYGGLAVGVPWVLRGRSWWLTWAGLSLAGAALEFGQWVLPTGRSADWRDGLANMAGVTLGLGLRWLLKRGVSGSGGRT